MKNIAGHPKDTRPSFNVKQQRKNEADMEADMGTGFFNHLLCLKARFNC